MKTFLLLSLALMITGCGKSLRLDAPGLRNQLDSAQDSFNIEGTVSKVLSNLFIYSAHAAGDNEGIYSRIVEFGYDWFVPAADAEAKTFLKAAYGNIGSLIDGKFDKSFREQFNNIGDLENGFVINFMIAADKEIIEFNLGALSSDGKFKLNAARLEDAVQSLTVAAYRETIDAEWKLRVSLNDINGKTLKMDVDPVATVKSVPQSPHKDSNIPLVSLREREAKISNLLRHEAWGGLDEGQIARYKFSLLVKKSEEVWTELESLHQALKAGATVNDFRDESHPDSDAYAIIYQLLNDVPDDEEAADPKDPPKEEDPRDPPRGEDPRDPPRGEDPRDPPRGEDPKDPPPEEDPGEPVVPPKK